MILQLFSGGWDSTYLAFQNLKQNKNFSLLYIDSQSIGDIDKVQKNCALKIHEKYLQDIFLDIWNFSIPLEWYNINVAQSFLFTIATFFYVVKTSVKIDEVQMGDIMGDDSISFLDERFQLWESLFKTTSVKMPKLTVPLKQITKVDVINFLNQKDLLWETNFCENSTKNNLYCGSCPSCKRVKYLLKDVIYIGKKPEFNDKESENRFNHFTKFIDWKTPKRSTKRNLCLSC